MFRSATFKLTMYYLIIIAVISVSFSAALYKVAADDMAFGLQRQSQRISDNFPVFSNSPYLHFGDELEDSRQHLLGRLVLCNLLVLLLAGFASYALARRTLRPIEAAHQHQKRFTADVSHELRTPLTALKMESEVALLDTEASKDQLRETLASNVEEAEKLTTLITTLLGLSQLDDGKDTNINEPISLNQAVNAAYTQVLPVAKQRDMNLSVELSSDATVRGEPTTLKQLFVILLENAIKYSPNGSKIIIASSLQSGQAIVSIKDHGNGIAKADLEHVFERFYRADAARTSGANSGFGLGLSIAKLIADNHGASISLTSRLNKGTTAQVTIPVVNQTKV